MGSHGALARVRKHKGILLGGAVAATGAVLLYRAYHSDRCAARPGALATFRDTSLARVCTAVVKG